MIYFFFSQLIEFDLVQSTKDCQEFEQTSWTNNDLMF